ncbi:MAG: amino acid permease [bacterium]|nr:amino acid permease [bacterium]
MPPAAKPLNLFDATMLVMGGIIGVGIFFNPQGVAQLVPERGPYFAMWILGALAALTGAMTFAELSATFPHTGGWYVFLREAFGSFPAFLFAWIVLFVVSTGASAAVADFCAQQVQALVWRASDPPGWSRFAIAAALIAAVTGLGLLGVKSGAVFQNFCMIAKLLAIGTFVVAGLALYNAPALASTPAQPSDGSLVSGMVGASLPVLFSYGGWQLITYVAPNVKSPQRTLPLAILLGVSGVAVVYLMVNVAYVRVLGMGGLADEPGFTVTMANLTLGDGGGTFVTAAMAVSSLGFLVACLITTPGIYVAMAREGLFLKAFGHRHARTGAPILALFVQGAVATAYLAWSAQEASKLAGTVVFAEWIFHCLCGLALLRIHWMRPELERPFRSPFFPLFPATYALLALAVVVGNLFASDAKTTGTGLGVLALGAVVYGPWKRLAGR